jgi:hypothetical protein
MQKLLETLAFTMLIGGQFLAAVVTISKRAFLFPSSKKQRRLEDQPRSSEHTSPEATDTSGKTAGQSRAARLLSDALSSRR